MKISQLKNFLAVVDYGSINKAAEKLFVSQPSLSRSIQSLEDEMGKDLLVRTNHGVSMTPTGKLLYYYGQSIINELNTLESLKVLDEKRLYSKLSISVSSIFLKDELILNCYRDLSSNETEIQMYETTTEEVLNNVLTLKSELGILVLNDYQLTVFKKMADIRDVDLSVLGSGPIYIHMNENDELSNKDSIHFTELMEHTYVHLQPDFFSNLNNSISIDGVQLSSFPKRLIMSNYHTMLNLVKKSKSFMIGNKWQIDELKHTHVKSLRLEDTDTLKHLIIIKRKNVILSDAAHLFLDIFKQNYEAI